MLVLKFGEVTLFKKKDRKMATNWMGNTRNETRWKIIKRKKQVLNCASMMAFAMTFSFAAMDAHAGPTGGVVQSGGSATIGIDPTDSNHTVIDQSTQSVTIHWDDFSTTSAETVTFNQPLDTSVAINRVVGGVHTNFNGILNANGNVFILNKDGITFGGTAVVNVGSLIATTADSVAESGGDYTFSSFGDAQVINNGNITVSNNGFAVLLAPGVENNGTIFTNYGQVELVSSGASDVVVDVDVRRDGLITYTVDYATFTNMGVTNTGTIDAGHGIIEISSATAADLAENVINVSGVVDADGLTAPIGFQRGGTIKFTGHHVNFANATVTADGEGFGAQGGTLRVDASGNALFSDTASFSAASGAGSFAIDFNITADRVGFASQVDLTGGNPSNNGDLNITIADTTNSLTIKDGTSSAPQLDAIYEQAIETNSQTGIDMEVISDTSLVVEDFADGVLQGGDGDIAFVMGNDGSVTFNDASDTIRTAHGSISLTNSTSATGVADNIIGHLETTQGGQIELDVNGSVIAGSLKTATTDYSYAGSGFGNIEVASYDGEIAISGDVVAIANADQATVDLTDTNIRVQPDVELTADGDIYVGGDITVAATSDLDIASSASANIIRGEASGNVYIESDIGDVRVDGDVTVSATNRFLGSASGSYAEFGADAILDVYAAGRIELAAVDVDVTSSLEGGGFSDQSVEAFVNISAGDQTAASDSVVVTGSITSDVDVDVVAKDYIGELGEHSEIVNSVTVDSGFRAAKGLDLANVSASTNVDYSQVEGYANVDTDTIVQFFSEEDASFGSVAVTSFVDQSASKGGDIINSMAEFDVEAEGGVEANGLVQVTSDVLAEQSSASTAFRIEDVQSIAKANFAPGEEGDVTINDDIVVTANLDVNSVDAVENSKTEAFLHVNQTAGSTGFSFGSGSADTVISGDMTVTATSVGHNVAQSDVDARAEIGTDSSVSLLGDTITVAASDIQTRSSMDTAQAASAIFDVDSVLNVLTGVFGDDIVIDPDATVTASGNFDTDVASAPSSGDINVAAEGIYSGDVNVDVNGNLNVAADMDSAISSDGSTDVAADAQATIGSALSFASEVNIDGTVTAVTTTNQDADNTATAGVSLASLGDFIMTYGDDPVARANAVEVEVTPGIISNNVTETVGNDTATFSAGGLLSTLITDLAPDVEPVEDASAARDANTIAVLTSDTGTTQTPNVEDGADNASAVELPKLAGADSTESSDPSSLVATLSSLEPASGGDDDDLCAVMSCGN